MKLFISWSGEFSRKVAECLSVWIPTIIQTVDVFYSPDDIAKGENWSNRLSTELEQSNFGIVCLTRENVLAPWINFEAGALSKVSNSRVSAIMLGITPSDVKGPLARFQNTAFNREDFHRLFQSINSSHEKPLKEVVLDHAFYNSWGKLERDIAAIIEGYSSGLLSPIPEKTGHDEHSSNSDALQELLRLVRNLDNQLQLMPNLDNGRNAPASNSVSSSTSDDDIDNIVLLFHCPKEHIDKALPIIRKYGVFSSPSAQDDELQDIEHKLRNRGVCLFRVPSHKFARFEHVMKTTVPEARIV